MRRNGLSAMEIRPGTLRFGANVMQLDNNGVQILTKGASKTAIFVFDDEFQPNPNTPTNPSTTPYAAVIGIVDRDAAQPYSSFSFDSFSGTATSELKAGTEDDTNDNAYTQSYVNVGSDIATVRHDMDAGRTFAQLILSNTVLELASFTSDPGTLNNGDVWYRSDTGKLYARINGATVELGGGSSMPMPPLVGTDSWHCLGTQLAANAVTAPASSTWPAANRALYIPLLVTEDITVTKLWVLNGTTASGNIDMGIYDSAFSRQVSIGSTAQAGTNVIQEFNIADTAITAGQYYIGIAMDNTTGTTFRYSAAGGSAAIVQGWGMAQEASAFALPATATPADLASSFMPICGIATRTQVA